jgi:hypothetical protein
MGKSGRPSKLTAETVEKLLSAIRAGNVLKIAAAYAGIGERTLHTWMQKGAAARSGEYRQFRQQVLEAEVGAEVLLVATIRAQASTNPSAARFILQQRHPERWRRKDGAEERPPAIEEPDRRRMTDAERIEEAHAALDLAREAKDWTPIAEQEIEEAAAETDAAG